MGEGKKGSERAGQGNREINKRSGKRGKEGRPEELVRKEECNGKSGRVRKGKEKEIDRVEGGVSEEDDRKKSRKWKKVENEKEEGEGGTGWTHRRGRLYGLDSSLEHFMGEPQVGGSTIHYAFIIVILQETHKSK